MIEKDPDECISNLEGLCIQLKDFSLKGSISDEDYMIHVLNNLPKEYDIILDGLENHLISNEDDSLSLGKIEPQVLKN